MALRAVLAAPPGVLPYALRVDEAWDDLVAGQPLGLDGGGGEGRGAKEAGGAAGDPRRDPVAADDDEDDFFDLV